MSDSSDADLLSIFWVEVNEYLESLNKALLQVEMAEGEAQHNLLREMNRVAHSMKGAARAVGISIIETISHYMEEVFGVALDNRLELTPDVADTIYDGLDLIQNVVDGEENKPDTVSEVLANLERIVAQAAAAPKAKPATIETEADDSAIDATQEMKSDLRHSSQEVAAVPDEPALEPEPDETPPAKPVSSDKPHFEPTDTMSTLTMRPIEETVRVTVSKLDRLMAEASELLVTKMHGDEHHRQVVHLRRVLGRWQREWRGVRAAYIRLARRMQESRDPGLVSELTMLFKFLETNQRYMTEASRQLTQLGQTIALNNMHLNTLADQLQDDIDGMRLLPFETIIGGFNRMVRDLARELKKQVQVDVVGAHVEIDKTVLDALKDPLMHILRNAIDHGIESPDEREAQGKPRSGRIVIRVEQRGSEIVISIEDDGRGLNIESIRARIVAHGLLSESEAAGLTADEIRSYVFHSGLSTSERVTALSGRGIGMDIVRDRVEALRGRVSVQSQPGEGSTIILSVPVSLTRIRCILLNIGGEDYALPSAMVTRMETIKRDDIFTAEGKDMVLLNNQPMPIVSMSAILGVYGSDGDDDEVDIISLRAVDRSVAFEVDALFSETELVLKPLGAELAHAPYIAGAAIMGSGKVMIILDGNDLVRTASGAALPRRRLRPVTISAATERALRVLVVDDSITTRTLEKNILETAGFDVYVAIDGVEAWAMLSDLDFDVVISDVEMPNMNGFELTRRIKDNTVTGHIPVILLTSLGKPEQREAGLRAGADAYLVKSRFDQGELLRTIQSVV